MDVDGFADTASRLYEGVGCDVAEAGPQYNATRIDESTPPSYSAAPAPARYATRDRTSYAPAVKETERRISARAGPLISREGAARPTVPAPRNR